MRCAVHWYDGRIYKKPPWSREPNNLLEEAGVKDISLTVVPKDKSN